MLALEKSTPDPLAIALQRKSELGAPGAATGITLAEGDDWRVVDVVCTTGPCDRPFEEVHAWSSFSLVLSGTFVYRSDHGKSLMSPGALLVARSGQNFECSHQHGEGDRCLSFQFHPQLFERLAYDAGTSLGALDRDRLPPLRPLAPLAARATLAVERQGSFEEIALELAGAAIQLAGDDRHAAHSAGAGDCARIAPVLRRLEAHIAEAQPLSELARLAGLSRYHFLRTFKYVTGVTPHQWLLRARLREAARRLVASDQPVTEIALAVGFEDLSNFIRSFRAEFGIPPGRYRAHA